MLGYTHKLAEIIQKVYEMFILESPVSIHLTLLRELLHEKQLPYSKESIRWFVENNPHITADSIQYYKKGKEWQFCYNNNFNVMACPNESNSSGSDSDCKVKGNISNKSGKKYYSHRI